MKKLATKANSHDWNMDLLPKLFWTPVQGTKIYEGHEGKQIRFKTNKSGQLYLIHTTYSDTQVFMQFEGFSGEENKSVVILATVGPDWKKGDPFQLPELI